MTKSHTVSDKFVFQDGESFNGAIARWAAGVYVERMMDVTRAAGVEWGHRQTAAAARTDAICALAKEMEVDAVELINRAMPYVDDQIGNHGRKWFYGLQLPATLIEGRIRRHAPAAFNLPGPAYHRALWDLRLLPVCLETGQLLLNICHNTNCEGGSVGWRHTLGIDRCEHCMTDLSGSQSDSLAPELLDSIRPIAGLFAPAARQASLNLLPQDLTCDGGQLAVDLLVHLLPVVDSSLKGKLNGLHLAEPVQLCEALAKSWDVMTGWPHRFQDFALMKVLNRNIRRNDGNSGQTVHFLKMKAGLTTSPALAQVATSVRDLINLGGPKRSEIAAATSSIKETARILGIETAQVAELRRNGALRSVLVLDADRLQPMFHRAELAMLTTGLADRLGFDSVRARLGISHHGVEQMADTGLIVVQTHPFFNRRYDVLQSTKSSFEAFLDALQRISCASLSGKTTTLTQVMKAVGGRFKPWAPAFECLLEQRIPFQLSPGPEPLVHRIHIINSDVSAITNLIFTPRISTNVAFSTKMSKQDAMETLNLAPRQITAMFAHIPTKKGERTKSLDVESVLAIAAQCISATELSARRGLCTQAAYADAIRVGVPNYGIAGFCRTTAEAKFFN